MAYAFSARTVGSGGSGGIFGPCMVVGAGVGAAPWRLAEPLGLAPGSPLVALAAGTAAFLGAVAHAPLGVLVMAAEMLGDASLLGPGILAVLCARAVTGGVTLYRSQPDRIEDGPAPVELLPPGRIRPAERRTTVTLVRREPAPGADPVAVNSTDRTSR
ncbi:chloride channel protein [Streptomyces sp. NPDC051636]|uniref:chloride channel protein n=1 Tax=Streptomyces sp. NPDC051636 TaxID=3365663 RepID=UPI0037BBBCC8